MKFVFLLSLALLGIASAVSDPEAVFAEATAQLDEGSPETAASNYENLVEADFHSTELYHNLGVAYHRLGRKEEALLQIYRAWLLDPFSSVAKANFLTQAKESNLSKSRLSQAEAQVAATAARTPLFISSFLAFWLGLLTVILVKKPLARGFGFAGIVIGLLLGGAAYYFHRTAPDAKAAWIISADATPIRASHGLGSPKISSATPLTQLEAGAERDDWTYVTRENGSGGWVPSSVTGLLQPWRSH